MLNNMPMGTGNVQLPPLQPQVAWDVEVEASNYSDEEFEDYIEEAETTGTLTATENPGTTSPLFNVPVSIMMEIIGYLEPDDLKIFFLCLRSIHGIDEDLWKEAVTQVYGSASKSNRPTWKHVFLDCFSLEKAFYSHQETKFTENKVKSFAFSFW